MLAFVVVFAEVAAGAATWAGTGIFFFSSFLDLLLTLAALFLFSLSAVVFFESPIIDVKNDKYS